MLTWHLFGTKVFGCHKYTNVRNHRIISIYIKSCCKGSGPIHLESLRDLSACCSTTSGTISTKHNTAVFNIVNIVNKNNIVGRELQPIKCNAAWPHLEVINAFDINAHCLCLQICCISLQKATERPWTRGCISANCIALDWKHTALSFRIVPLLFGVIAQSGSMARWLWSPNQTVKPF